MAGVYANFANVSHSDYEFTLTFARVDHEVEEDEVPGVVVSRVYLSPRFMRELIDAMEDNWSKWRTRGASSACPRFGAVAATATRPGAAFARAANAERLRRSAPSSAGACRAAKAASAAGPGRRRS